MASGIVLLQVWLGFLWENRAPAVGLAMPFRWFGQERIPHLGAPIYFVPLGILAMAAFLRIAEARPRAVAGLVVETRSLSRWARSLAVLVVLYGGLGVVAAVVEHLLFHHFITMPAHHVTIVVLLLGVPYAGRRRPFLGVSLSPPLGCSVRRRRRLADAVVVTLLVLVYASWVAYRPLTELAYRWTTVQTIGFHLVAASLAALLAWALLHSSAVDLGAMISGRLEARFEAIGHAERPGGSGSRAVVVWASHLAVAAAVLGAGHGWWQWSSAFWAARSSTRLFGVDWYFANVWSAVTAAEAVIVPSVALLAGLDLYRTLAGRE